MKKNRSRAKPKDVNTPYGLGVIVDVLKYNKVDYVKLKMYNGLNLILPKRIVK